MDTLNPNGQPTVTPIHAITRPMPNTKLKDPVYFHCTLPTASLHRPDGKKLPFVNNFLKCEIQEDADYLRSEIDAGNPYIREATPEEVKQSKMRENPVQAIKDQVKAEVENSYSLEELQALIEKKKQVGQAQPANAPKVIKAEGSGFTGATTSSVAAATKS